MNMCDKIQWFIDFTGTNTILPEFVYHFTGEDPEIYDIGDRINKKDGLYFNGYHWYSMKDKKLNDSYKMKYQIKGTNNFCQTYAAIIYSLLDKEFLKKEKYDYNIKICVDMWYDVIFNTSQERTDFFINEMKIIGKENQTFQVYNFNTGESLGKLSSINKKKLKIFINSMKDNTRRLFLKINY